MTRDHAWRVIARDADVEPGSLHTVRADGLQLVLGRTEAGELFCLDNRCPHEGYPLTQGYLADDCSLTCAWHNWKFRVADGACLLGGEDVRRYPVRLAGDAVEVDLSPPDPARETERLLASLGRALLPGRSAALGSARPAPVRAPADASHRHAVPIDVRAVEGDDELHLAIARVAHHARGT